MPPSRRAFLAGAGGSLATLAGCLDGGTTPPSGSDSTYTGDRPTATPREPDSLSVSGAWPQFGMDETHAGVSPAAGVPDDGRPYWTLRRIRSGPAVLADGRLFHYAKLGENPDDPVTLTRTREPDAGTAHPVYGVPHLIARGASEGRIRWTRELPDRAVGWPAVGAGRVVATTRGWIAAHDAADGTTVWTKDLGDRPVGDPTVVGDAVVVPLSGIVSGQNGEVVVEPTVRAYDLADGSERWTASAPERGLGLAVVGDAVVVVSHGYDGSGTVLARSLADGSERWRTAVPGNFFEGPVVAGGTVYVAAGGGHLRALALADGSERWTAREAGDGLAASGDAVYAAHGKRVVARDAADGSRRWSFEAEGGSFTTPAVGDGVVYAGGHYVDLYALDAVDGSERWSHGFPEKVVEGDIVRSGLEAQPAVADGAVYAYATDGLYAFGPAG